MVFLANEDETNEAMFMQLVMSLQGSAWMMMGKVQNPITGKTEKNLEAAKATIDTLVALRAKTKGNLRKAEEDLLDNAISQVQINYVEESSKKQEKVEKKKEESKVEEKIVEEQKEEPEK